MTPILCPTLLGRDEERERLTAALTAAGSDCGSATLVLGDAGMGKSRLVSELRGLALDQGFTVLVGRAVQAETPIPFRPLAEGLLGAFRATGPPSLASLQPVHGALGRLVPEWREDDTGVGDVSLVLVAEAMLRVLRVLARSRGCLLILEDIHWADPETLAVLEYLADNVSSERVLCTATVRTDEPSPALLLARSLAARRVASIVELTRLGRADVERVAEACLGSSALPGDLIEPLHTWADGVPFLVEELLAAWVDAGALTKGPSGWLLRSPVGPVVPPTFAQTVWQRVTGLASDGQAVLTAAAVLGRHFDASLLAAVTGLSDATLMAVLRRCVAAQLIVDRAGDGRADFALRHALTREAILGQLLAPERAELSRRALHAVEEAYPTLHGNWLDLAGDLAQAGGDFDRAARLLAMAARRALARGALASAEALLVRARGLVGPNVDITTSVDELLTEVLSASGKVEAALDAGERLLATLRAQPATASRQAEVHLRLARALLASRTWASATDQLDRARRLAHGSSGDVLAARVDALAAHVALGEGRLEDAEALARSALAAAEADGIPEVACEALEVIGRRMRRSDLREAETAFERSLSIAEAHGLMVWRIRALQELASIDVVTSRRLDRLTAAREIAEQAGALAAVAVVDLHIATVLAFRFEVQEGLVVARRCADAARRLKLGGLVLPMAQARQALLPMALVRQAQCHAVSGNAEEMEACISEALALAGGDPEVSAGIWGQCRATLSLLRENRAQALRELDIGEGFVRDRPTALLWVFRGIRALLCALESRDGEAARAELSASGLTTLPHHRAFLGYCEAVGLGRSGRPAEAANAFAAGRRAMAEAGGEQGTGYLALRLVAQAAVEDEWGDPVQWLREAEDFFEGSGHDRVASACRSLLAKAGAPRRRRGVGEVPPALASLGVSDREHEVLALVAGRLSNREIAARMYLSPRTVDKHVQHLLAKTGLHSRAELSDLAVRLGVTGGTRG
jgi:DNA-binding CsgD family transcriptional regulator/tetratricopeptide (TPR) repeat protein